MTISLSPALSLSLALSLSACTSSLLPEITASPSLLPLLLRLSFLFSSLSPLVIYSSLSDLSFIYLFLAFEVRLVCLSVYVVRTYMRAAGCVSTADSCVIMPV